MTSTRLDSKTIKYPFRPINSITNAQSYTQFSKRKEKKRKEKERERIIHLKNIAITKRSHIRYSDLFN